MDVPDWWVGEFARRQGMLRGRLAQQLDRMGRALTFNELRQLSTNYLRREMEHALGGMIAEGLVVRFERTEPLYHGARQVTRTYTYYDLTSRSRRARAAHAATPSRGADRHRR